MEMRDYRPDDLVAIHAINEAEAPAVGSVTPEELARIVDWSVIALVVEVDGEIGGFCLVLPPGTEYGSSNYAWFGERFDDFVYLDRIAVASAHQRRGIGRAVYDEVERLAAERRPSATVLALEVNVRPHNGNSLAFHKQLGFETSTERETPYGARVVMMSKPLGYQIA